jgi:tRNA A-37 threonylcarbamoyl transferase component Bud32
VSQAFARALALFDDCVALPPAERAGWLAGLALRDPDAHRALQRLLASDGALQDAGEPDLLPGLSLDTLGARIDVPASGHPADARIGSRLGPWRIERVLESGGMGTVYEAWRDDGQYQQRVALKCIRGELTSPRLVESFRREREALAALDHPGIATLFDGGVEPDGQPWFAMRYVQGAQIDAWCDARQAGLRTRVELLVQACDALAYAHQRLVLHQDIKPSNLMVNDTGQVQMLDFGLTASLAATDTLPRLAASDGYTAPEALAGTLPAVTMDVWSMGVLMYRLLAGALPHASTRLLSTLLTQDDGQPLLLSQLAAQATPADAQARGVDTPGALARALRGDLDAIAARCIARAPEQRYRSIGALRDDLRAWLQQRPVQAREGGIAYRGARLLARHRLAASLAALALVVAAGSLGVMVWQERRAARENASSLALSQVFERMLGHATLSGLGDTPMSSRALLQDTERQVRALPLREHPQVLARGLSVLARNYSVVGEYDRATRLAREAATLQAGDDGANARNQATLAALLNLQGKSDEAGRLAQEALAGLDDDEGLEVRLQLMAEAARSEWNLADPAGAQRTLDDALVLAQKANLPLSVEELRLLRGQWSVQRMRFKQAQADFDHVIAATRQTHPLIANEARRQAAWSLTSQNRVDTGLPMAQDMLVAQRATQGDDHPLTGSAWTTLASLQCAAGQQKECAASLQRAEPLILRYFGDRHPEYARLLQVRSLLSPLGNAITQEEGIALMRRALAITRANFPPDHERVLMMTSMLARRLVIQGNPSARRTPGPYSSEAIGMLERSIALWERKGLPVPPQNRVSLAQAYGQRGDRGDDERAHAQLEANRGALSLFDPGYFGHFHNALVLAQVNARMGHLDRAAGGLETMMVALRGTQSALNNRIVMVQAMLLRAAIAQRAGDRNLTRDWLERALAEAKASLKPGSELSKIAQDRLQTIDRGGRFRSELD